VLSPEVVVLAAELSQTPEFGPQEEGEGAGADEREEDEGGCGLDHLILLQRQRRHSRKPSSDGPLRVIRPSKDRLDVDNRGAVDDFERPHLERARRSQGLPDAGVSGFW
jgi:hypothetical protein